MNRSDAMVKAVNDLFAIFTVQWHHGGNKFLCLFFYYIEFYLNVKLRFRFVNKKNCECGMWICITPKPGVLCNHFKKHSDCWQYVKYTLFIFGKLYNYFNQMKKIHFCKIIKCFSVVLICTPEILEVTFIGLLNPTESKKLIYLHEHRHVFCTLQWKHP